jgi:hypothetical protein
MMSNISVLLIQKYVLGLGFNEIVYFMFDFTIFVHVHVRYVFKLNLNS